MEKYQNFFPLRHFGREIKGILILKTKKKK